MKYNLLITNLSDMKRLLSYSGQYGGPSNIVEYRKSWRVQLPNLIKTPSFKIKLYSHFEYNVVGFNGYIDFYNDQDAFLFLLEFSDLINED